MKGPNVCAMQRVECGAAKRRCPGYSRCGNSETSTRADRPLGGPPDVSAYPFRPLLPIPGRLMAVSRRLRFEVLKRDNYTCRYCGAKAPDVTLTVDHVIPTTLGGDDEPTNLVTACQPCNAGKSSVSPESGLVADVEADALRWAKALEAAAWHRTISRRTMECDVAEFGTHWLQWTNNVTGKTLPRPGGWEDSIERFLALGITPEEMKRLVRVSMTRGVGEDVWRYFCGCCWRAVTDLQETARRYLEADANG